MYGAHQVKVHIFGIQDPKKCALSCDVPQTWFNN